MKIAIVNTWAISKKAIGGTERFVMDLAKSFAENNNQVDVYMFSGNTHIEDVVNYININLFNMIGEADEYIVQEAFGNFETDKSYLIYFLCCICYTIIIYYYKARWEV